MDGSDAIAGEVRREVPFFDVHIFVCCNRRPDGHQRGSCAEKGSERLRDYMKARVKELGLETPDLPSSRVNAAGCLDRCELGPCLVVYPAGVWYRVASEADVESVIAAHLRGRDVAGHLRLPGR